MVRQLSSLTEFNTAISSGNIVVVDFFATWCGPCKVIAPAFEKMADQYKQATFLKCDVDQNQDISKEQGVRAMPTFNIYKGGKKVATVMGADARKLEAAIREHAGAPSSSSSGSHNWGAGKTLGSTTSASQTVKAPLHQPAIQTGRDVVSTVTNLDPSAKLLLGLFVVYLLEWRIEYIRAPHMEYPDVPCNRQ